MPELIRLPASGGTNRPKKISSMVEPCRYDLVTPFSRNGRRLYDPLLYILDVEGDGIHYQLLFPHSGPESLDFDVFK